MGKVHVVDKHVVGLQLIGNLTIPEVTDDPVCPRICK